MTEPSGGSRYSAGPRVMAIIGAVLAIGAFFAPYFRVKSWLVMNETLLNLQNAADKSRLTDALNTPWTIWPLGWSFWYGIVAFALGIFILVLAILDLSLRKIRIVRILCTWLIFTSATVITLATAVGGTLGFFGIGMIAPLPDDNGVDKITVDASVIDAKNERIRKRTAEIRKENKVVLDAITKPEDRDAEQKKLNTAKGDPADWDKVKWQVSVIPVAASAPIVGGVLALIASLMMIPKKK